MFVLSLLSCTRQASFPMDKTSSWSLPNSFHILWTTLSHHIPASPTVIFSHTALSPMAGNPFSGMLFTSYSHFNFLTSLLIFVLRGYIPGSALNTVLLVVLEHPGILGGGGDGEKVGSQRVSAEEMKAEGQRGGSCLCSVGCLPVMFFCFVFSTFCLGVLCGAVL